MIIKYPEPVYNPSKKRLTKETNITEKQRYSDLTLRFIFSLLDNDNIFNDTILILFVGYVPNIHYLCQRTLIPDDYENKKRFKKEQCSIKRAGAC